MFIFLGGGLTNMSIIRDKQSALGTIYIRYNRTGEIIQKEGVVGFIKESTKTKHTYFILVDIRGRLIHEANYYLNKLLEKASYKNRERAFNALKVFYSYVFLFNMKDYKTDFTVENLNSLISFLEGGYREGVSMTLDLKTARGKETINSYVGVYSNFYEDNFRQKNNIFRKASTNNRYSSPATQKRKFSSFATGTTLQAPKYIKEDQFKMIMDFVDEHYGLREKIIINLMYHYGLRIGEVLGLTFEDIEPLDNQRSKIIIRNRVSDAPFQKAKGVLTPNTKEDYKKPIFTEYGVGFQVVIIDNDLAEQIEEYLDETRDPRLLSASNLKSENLKIKAIADRIGSIPLLNNINQYIFLSNQHYTPLTQQGWNYTLKKIFEGVAIPIDNVVKSINLNHRFRHSFAMKLVKKGVDILQLKEAMRHKSIESCKAYYNPDEEDQIQLQEMYIENSKEKYNFDE